MNLKISKEEVKRIGLTIVVFSFLTSLFVTNARGGISLCHPVLLIPVTSNFLISLLAFVSCSIPFHIMARAKGWQTNVYYNGAGYISGFITGSIILALQRWIAATPIDWPLIFILGLIVGGGLGLLCAQAFFAFVVSDERKVRKHTCAFWALIMIPAAFSLSIGCFFSVLRFD